MRRESSDSVKVYYPEITREELLSRLKEGAKRLTEVLPVVCVVLFGSYAENRQTIASDVDLLIVYRDPKNESDYSLAWDAFGIPMLEPHVYTISQYGRGLRQNSQFCRWARQSGVLIYGELPVEG